MSRCPGLYCGWIRENGTFDQCGPCPQGYRSFSSYEYPWSVEVSPCWPCESPLRIHDWLYLMFMYLSVLLGQFYLIDKALVSVYVHKQMMLLHLSAFLETSLAAILTLAIYSSPLGSFTLVSCGSVRLSDWYTVLHNPSAHKNPLKKPIRCTYEAVYPLYSMMFVFLFFCLIAMLIMRPLFVRFIRQQGAMKTLYLGLYLIPTVASIHLIAAGVLYYSFHVITLIISLISVARHLAMRLNQHMPALFLESFKSVRQCLILLCHWAVHAFAIFALTEDSWKSYMFMLVPLPSLFYMMTSRFTNPNNFHSSH